MGPCRADMRCSVRPGAFVWLMLEYVSALDYPAKDEFAAGRYLIPRRLSDGW